MGLSVTMCVLIEELCKLKKSSMEAVDNESSFSKFKQYMHVHRQVEDDLKGVIEKAKASGKKSLVLVCGNVGDGKSHLISYLKNHDENYLDGFYIHNDATESRCRSRDEKQELAKVLSEFSDENLNNGSYAKVIVAINLGVLSNFIESEEGKAFTKLAQYVADNKILIDTDMIVEENADEVFYHVNFGDYHIFRLTNGKVDSPYIMSIIDKIFQDNSGNTFYGAYSQCHFCELSECCPVKCNYEMMSNPAVKNGIVDLLLETIVKDKLILSTRELLEFMYDIIVPPSFKEKKYIKLKFDEKLECFIKYSLPSLLYDHNDISLLFAHIQRYDFKNRRTEAFDEVITRFNNTENVKAVLEEYISDNPCLKYVLKYDADTLAQKKSLLLSFMGRMCRIAPKSDALKVVNEEYLGFISDLYYANKNDKVNIKKLYDTVKRCIYLWNGSADGKLNLNINNEDYVISTSLALSPDISRYGETKSETAFEKFPAYINVTYQAKNDPSKKATVSIDYDLYKMLKQVESGYRPTAKDCNFYAGFVSFINKLSAFSRSDEEITIKHYDRDEIKEYLLEKNDFGLYEFREVL